MKRYLDIILSLIVIAVGFPIILVVLLVDFIFIRQFPIIIQQRALGLEKKKICLIKIRTIKNNTTLPNNNNAYNILKHEELKTQVPRFCKWLRKSGIDEILQVFNVLKGDMSLVGPRPIMLKELKLLKEKHPSVYKRQTKLNSLPGITGYWQIYGDREKGVMNLVEDNEFYEFNSCLSLDVKIMIKTFIVMVTATHSDSIFVRNVKLKNYPGRIVKEAL